MGCDIHCFVEVRHKTYDGGMTPWEPWDADSWYYDPYVSIPVEVIRWRDYLLFSALAGIRNSFGVEPISEPRGIPDDVSKEVRREYDSWGLDGHSHSWLSLDELKAVDWDAYSVSGGDLGYMEVVIIPYLEYLNTKGGELRIVFWFDN